MDPERRNAIKHALQDTMMKVDQISSIITDNLMNMGDLNKREVSIVNDIKNLKEEYGKLVTEYNDSEYEMFQFISANPDKLKKHDQLYKKLHAMREKRLQIIEKIKDKSQEIAAIQISKEGSGEVHKLLDGEYEKMVKKLENAKKNFPDIFNEIRRHIATKADDHVPAA